MINHSMLSLHRHKNKSKLKGKVRQMEINQQELKRYAGERAVDFVKNGDIVGLGTGSTIYFALKKLGEKVAQGLEIKGVPTSYATERVALDLGIPILELNEVKTVDLVIDGADEIDSRFNMIKGGGGALTREKLVALAAKRRVIVIDESKLVSQLGYNFLLPVEVLPFGWQRCSQELAALNCHPHLRSGSKSIFETDNGNYILDCKFEKIVNARELRNEIKLIPGVIESGLFVGLADVLVIGFSNKIEVRFKSMDT